MQLECACLLRLLRFASVFVFHHESKLLDNEGHLCHRQLYSYLIYFFERLNSLLHYLTGSVASCIY
jgi:hypothetical protein